MRAVPVLAAVALTLAACGEKPEPDLSQIAAPTAKTPRAKRTTAGCIKLWNGPHIGSTRLQWVAARHTTYARVEVEKGRCRVSFASEDATVFGRYLERTGSAGPWTLDAERAPERVVRRVIDQANASGHEDGTLTPGPP